MYVFDSDRDQAVSGTEAECPSLASDFTAFAVGYVDDDSTSNLSVFTLGDGEEFRITLSPGSTSNQVRFRGKEGGGNRIANVTAGGSAFEAGERVLIAVTHESGTVTVMAIRSSDGSPTVYSNTVAATALDTPSDRSIWCMGSSADATNGVGGSIGAPEGAFAFCVRNHAIDSDDLLEIWNSGRFTAPMDYPIPASANETWDESTSGAMNGLTGCTFALGFQHFEAGGRVGGVVQSPETCYQGTSLDETTTCVADNSPTYGDPFTLGWTRSLPKRALSAAISAAEYVGGVSGKAAALGSGSFTGKLRVVVSNRSRATRLQQYAIDGDTAPQNYWDGIARNYLDDVIGVLGQTPRINSNNGRRIGFDCGSHGPYRSNAGTVVPRDGNWTKFGSGNAGNFDQGAAYIVEIPDGEDYEILARTDEAGFANDADLDVSYALLVGPEVTVNYSRRSYTKQADDGGSTEVSTGTTGAIGDGSTTTETGRVSSTTTQIVYSGDLSAGIAAGDMARVLSGTNAGSVNCVLSVSYDSSGDETTIEFQGTWHDGTSTFSPANDDEIEYSTWSYHVLSETIPDQTGTNPSHNFRGLRISPSGGPVWLWLLGDEQDGNGIVIGPHGAGGADDEELLGGIFSQDGGTPGDGHEKVVEVLDPDVWLQFLNEGPDADDYQAWVEEVASSLAAHDPTATLILVGDRTNGGLGSGVDTNVNEFLERAWTLGTDGTADGVAILVEQPEHGRWIDQAAGYGVADAAHLMTQNVQTGVSLKRLLASLPESLDSTVEPSRGNHVLKRVDTPPSGWLALADAATVLAADLICEGAGLNLRFNGGDSLAVPAGTRLAFESLDLATVEVSGDGYVIVAGSTP